MEPQIRQLLERTTPDSNGSATSSAEPARAQSVAERRTVANAPAAPTASERRLKWVIECAPVGLVITDSAGDVLAANKAALALFGPERLDDVLKKPLDRLVAQEDRNRLVAFISEVCQGRPGTLEYEVLQADGKRRSMETRAVPLQREANAPTVFLSATWDVTDWKRSASTAQQWHTKHDLVEAERDALKELVQEAQAAQRKLSQEREAEQQMHDATLHDAGSKSKAALADAEQRHQHEAGEWAAERAALLEQLKDSCDQHQQHAGEWAVERDALLKKVHEAEQHHEHHLGQLSSERDALLAKLKEASDQHEHHVRQWVTEREELRAKFQGTHDQQQQLADQWSSERDRLLSKLREATDQHQHHASEWSADRAALLAKLSEAGDQLQHQAGQWSSERDVLLSKLQDAEDRLTGLAGQLLSEQSARQATLERVEREHEARLQASAAENQRLESALGDLRVRCDEIQAAARTECDSLATTIGELEFRYAQLGEERRAERQQLESALRNEKLRVVPIMNEHERWQVELSETAGALKDAGRRIEALLNTSAHQLHFRMEDDSPDAVVQRAQPVGASAAKASADDDEDNSWRF
jgi:PAS domain S-box-containing protein